MTGRYSPEPTSASGPVTVAAPTSAPAGGVTDLHAEGVQPVANGIRIGEALVGAGGRAQLEQQVDERPDLGRPVHGRVGGVGTESGHRGAHGLALGVGGGPRVQPEQHADRPPYVARGERRVDRRRVHAHALLVERFDFSA